MLRTFFKGPRANVTARIVLELIYFEAAVQDFNH